MEKKTMVIDGRMHMEGDDGLFRRVPLGMDEARLKEDHPVYRMEVPFFSEKFFIFFSISLGIFFFFTILWTENEDLDG